MPRGKTLTVKQKAFIHHYLLERNASKAARLAGYKDFEFSGGKTLAHPLVAAEIARYEKQAQEKFELTQEKIITELIKHAFDEKMEATIGDVMDWDGNNKIDLIAKNKLSAIQIKHIKAIKQVVNKDGDFGVHIEMREVGKIEALKLLGQHIGMFKKGKIDEGAGDNRPRADETTRAALIESLRGIARKAGEPK
jgi:hypothetical protein